MKLRCISNTLGEFSYGVNVGVLYESAGAQLSSNGGSYFFVFVGSTWDWYPAGLFVPASESL